MTHGLMRGHGSRPYASASTTGPPSSAMAITSERRSISPRVSGLASGGEVLVTGGTAALAPDLEGV